MPKRELFNRQGDALMMIYRLNGRVPKGGQLSELTSEKLLDARSRIGIWSVRSGKRES
jgi:hypothetical protein